jgi:D-alanyl-D-alanine carboxypeptidase/D-alanyl-D-alanine-endopeptidase (penicillin-binding protein 4)
VRSRAARSAALAALGCLAGCGGASHRAAPPAAAKAQVASLASPPSTATATTPAAAAAQPAPPPTPLGGRRELRQALGHWLGEAGPHTGAYVFDLTTANPVYALNAGVGRPPASVEKLYTTAALLSELGPAERLSTEVLGAGSMGAHGVWHGDLYLHGGGDPTFGSAPFVKAWSGAGATVEELADQIERRARIRRVTGHVIADPSLFDTRPGGPATAYKADTPDFGGLLGALTYNHGAVVKLSDSPAVFAAQQLAALLRRAHVAARTLKVARRAPGGAAVLASVQSPTIGTLVRLMDVPSDDLYAEMLTEQLGSRLARRGTIASGAREIARAVAEFGIHARIVDGSGLSRANRSSPLQVVKLLADVWRTPLGRALEHALPVVGVNGTVKRIAAGTPATGHCAAKTGTLNYVTNLAGYCAGAGGQTLAFAIFIDGPANGRAIELLDRIIPDLVRLDVTQP